VERYLTSTRREGGVTPRSSRAIAAFRLQAADGNRELDEKAGYDYCRL